MYISNLERNIKIILVGVNKGPHDASVALFEGDNLQLFIESERLSNIKHDASPFLALNEIRNNISNVDAIVLAGLSSTTPYDSFKFEDAYSATLCSYRSFKEKKYNVYDDYQNHHKNHAATSFYNSGFKEALCIVKDGFGSLIKPVGSKFMGREISSSFIGSYPDTFTLIDQHVALDTERIYKKQFFNKVSYGSSTVSEAAAFELTAIAFGLNYYDAGKIMGMSAYGVPDSSIPDIIDKNGLINKNIFSYEDNPDTKSIYKKVLKFKYPVPESFQEKANFAYKLQSQIQEHVLKYVLEMLKLSNKKSLCLSGGFFLNCVSNNYLLKNLPKDIDVYVDPLCLDSGTSIGATKLLYKSLTKSSFINPLTDLYLGQKYSYSISDLNGYSVVKTSTKNVAKLLSEKNIIAIYQGRSEAGPRALGNRSILYDPRDKEGKDKVNTVKKREWFRPFGGTVLLDYANDWFNMRSLKESPFMMFALDVNNNKKHLIPAIVHEDGTCRIQTLKIDTNVYFYNLIKEFYEITKVPVLLNTSFNLAGNTLVETLEDALWTLKNSNIDYLYLPELGVLVE